MNISLMKYWMFLICFIFVSSIVGSAFTISTISNDIHENSSLSLIDLMSQVNTSRMQNWIQDIQDFGPHPTGSLELDALKGYLLSELAAMNVTVSLHPWELNNKSGENIIVTQQGIEWEDITIVCAHYDSIGISPGADDDGSGVASVLMLADILRGYNFSGTIKYILFSGEEQGLLGSKEYVKEVIAQNDTIVGVLALDKIGYAETAFDGSIVRHHADPKSEWMIRMSHSIASEHYDEIGLEVVGLPFDVSSDHKAFVDQGFVGSNFVENYLNPQYHTSEDLLEYMNMSYLTKICKLSLGVVVSLAEFNPQLDNSDISIQIVGTRFAENCQFSVVVLNEKYLEDTANLTINISLRYLFRPGYVLLIKDFYTTPATWEFDKEVGDRWEFKVSGRQYSRGLFRIDVRVLGFNDDVNLRISSNSYGLILGKISLFMLSKM